MFTRITHWTVSNLTEMELLLNEQEAKIKAIPGIQSCHVLWTGDGTGVTVATYASEADANRAATEIQSVWDAIARIFTTPPKTKTYTLGRALV